jgi:hypothetical protein
MVRPTVAAVRPAIANRLRSLCPAGVHRLSRLDALRRSRPAVGGAQSGKSSTETVQRCIGQHGTVADLQLIFEDRCGTGRYAPARNEIRYPGLVKI